MFGVLLGKQFQETPHNPRRPQIPFQLIKKIHDRRVSFTWMIIHALLASMLILSWWAQPTFSHLGIAEIGFLAIVGLSVFLGFINLAVSHHNFSIKQRWLILALGAYGLSFAISGLLGIAAGAPLVATIRSLGPYACTFFMLLWAFSRVPQSFTLLLYWVLAIGCAQSALMVYQYLTLNTDFSNLILILANRITLFDPRATIPFFLAAAVIPLCMIAKSGASRLTFSWLFASSLAILAASASLTRTSVAAALLGIIVVTVVMLVYSRPQQLRPLRVLVFLCGIVVVLGATYSLPAFQPISKLLQARSAVEMYSASQNDIIRRSQILLWNYILSKLPEETTETLVPPEELSLQSTVNILAHHGVEARPIDVIATLKSNNAFGEGASFETDSLANFNELDRIQIALWLSSGEQKIGGGRFDDEWLPALNRYLDGSLTEHLFGIGAGIPFSNGSGGQQTYIHNLFIYILLYNGAIGLTVTLFMYGATGWTLLSRWRHGGDALALSALGLLAAMSGFAMFFAAHKLTSYNLILGVIAGYALAGSKTVSAASKPDMLHTTQAGNS